MKIVWVFVFLLLAVLLVDVQGKGGKGGGGRAGGFRGVSGGKRSSTRGFKKTLKKAAVVGVVAYGGYQVGSHGFSSLETSPSSS